MVRQPSWHQMEKAVLAESPRTWEEARKAGDLLWDVDTAPVYRRYLETTPGMHYADCPPDCSETHSNDVERYDQIEGYQELTRDDTGATLSVQQSSYEVIRNADFGGLIDVLLGLEADEYVDFEALMSLYGGRSIVALVTFPSPLVMPWDPSANYAYCAFQSRHDGNGGLRGIPTNVRVQCANTLNQAEMTDGRKVGFTIRHTSNWKDRIEEVRRDLITARGESKQWVDFAEKLAAWNVGGRQRETFLKRFLPASDDMGERQRENVLTNRDAIRTILKSPTCDGIADNGYGLLMASTEWSDHHRSHQSSDSYVARQLLRKEPSKAKASLVLREMAGIK